MKKLHLDLSNCYSIKKLEADFDFTQHKVYAVYAPNGVMKSSLAHTFKDLAEGSASKDVIFPTRVSSRTITDEKGTEIPKEQVLVVAPYDEVFAHTEKTSTLLVDTKLRKEYEALHVEIDQAKDVFLKALKEQSKSKKDLEKEISSTFTPSDSQFYRALIRVKDEVLALKEAAYADVQYDVIFDEKVLSVLKTKDFKTAIEGLRQEIQRADSEIDIL
jgi:energy-coupling factor transporter ATP-binding protein EcfA2